MFQSQTCNVFIVSLIKLRAVISLLSPGVPFGRAVRAAVSHRMRPGAWPLGAVVPAARLVSIRHVDPNGSDGSALGAWLFYDIC